VGESVLLGLAGSTARACQATKILMTNADEDAEVVMPLNELSSTCCGEPMTAEECGKEEEGGRAGV